MWMSLCAEYVVYRSIYVHEQMCSCLYVDVSVCRFVFSIYIYIYVKKCVVACVWMSLCVEYVVYRGIYTYAEICSCLDVDASVCRFLFGI